MFLCSNNIHTLYMQTTESGKKGSGGLKIYEEKTDTRMSKCYLLRHIIIIITKHESEIEKYSLLHASQMKA